MKKTIKDKVNYYLFKISYRNGEKKEIRGFLASKFTEEGVKEELVNWCESFPFFRSSESIINYSFTKIKIPTRKTLLKKWEPLCKKKNKINDEWDMVRMMLLHAK